MSGFLYGRFLVAFQGTGEAWYFVALCSDSSDAEQIASRWIRSTVFDLLEDWWPGQAKSIFSWNQTW